MVRTLSVREAAQMLGCSERSLYTRWWRRRHQIPAVKIGKFLRFREGDLERVLSDRVETFGAEPGSTKLRHAVGPDHVA